MKKCLKCKKALTGVNFYGLHVDCYRDWFKDSEMKGFDQWDLKKSGFSSFSDKSFKREDFPAGPMNSPSTFYHGRYLKYSAQIGSRKYILKVQEEKFPYLPEMEYICNKIADFLDLKPAEHYLICLSENNQISEQKLEAFKPHLTKQHNKIQLKQKSKESLKVSSTVVKKAFITRNFMQDLTGSLHHIYKFLPNGLKNYSCKNIIKEIHLQTGHPIEEKKFTQIVLFDSLIGNNDRHGRNLALIDTGKNKTLAPIYDNPSFFGIAEEWNLSMNFNISGCIQTSHSKNPKIRDYAMEFKRLGQINSCQQFVRKVEKVLPKIIEEVQNSDLSQKRKLVFIKYIKKQLKTLEDYLKRII